MFLAESRERSSKGGMSHGTLVDCESQRILKLFSPRHWHNCTFFEVLWFMSVSPWITDGSIG